MANVIFKVGTQQQYNALQTKDTNTLYWLTDVQELRKGNLLFGVGKNASENAAGLMSAEDKQALDAIIAGGGAVKVPSYTVELQATPESGSVATYKLKKTVDGESEYVGDPINIPADKVIQSGELKYVETADEPYTGAMPGDPYIDLVLSDEAGSHIYVPVKGLVDIPGAGDGIQVIGNVVSIKLDAANANGLKVGPAGLAMDLATESSAGAMSAEDKKELNALPAKYLKRMYEVLDSTAPLPAVKYNDGEIRVMYAPNTNWQSQQVGAGGNPERYYVAFRAYAPAGAVKFREYTDAAKSSMPSDTPMEALEGNSFAGMDVYGRQYSVVWLPVAKHNEDGTWSYFGDNSAECRYIGWYYGVEWYDTNENLISADTVRINLSNASCHTSTLPYYLGKYATKEDLKNVSIQWGAISEV